MTCTELELLLCDYIDGTLPAAERRNAEVHLAECAACAELARDSAAVIAFVGRVADVEPPHALVTRILQQVPTSQPATVKARGAFGKLVGRILDPILQPRLVMGMAMTILSFAMLGRFAGIEARQLRPADLSPVKIVEASEDKLHRAWNRAVKYYQSLRVVYEVQSVLRELTETEEEAGAPASQSPPAPTGVENQGPPK
jgi:anti-sigma factor RsiW